MESTWRAVVHFMTFSVSLALFVSFFFPPFQMRVNDPFSSVQTKKNYEEVELSHTNVSIFRSHSDFIYRKLDACSTWAISLLFFFILAQSQLNWIRNRNLRTLRMYIEKVHIMLNAQRTTMMKTFSCSLFSLASRREWFVYVQHTNRLYLVWKSVTRFVGECLCVWTVNAPAVSFDDNDRDRRSLVECKRGQTFRIKKIHRRQLDEHSVRDHIIFVSPVRLHFWNVYSDHSDWLRNRVWPTASAIYSRTLNRKNGAIDFVTAHDAMKYRITFGVDFITVRVSGRLCSFTVYDYLLLSSLLRWISRTRATNHRVTSSSVHFIKSNWWRIFALHLQSIV